MKINGLDVKPSRNKVKGKARVPVSGNYCRWESSVAGASVVSHRHRHLAVYRAVHLHGAVRSVAYLPDGVVHHGEWRRV